jgi:hypothetical protein
MRKIEVASVAAVPDPKTQTRVVPTRDNGGNIQKCDMMQLIQLQAIQAFMAEKKLIVVHVAYDPEAKVWWTESSDLFGLNACASSLDEFRTILPGMVQDLIELNEPSWAGHDVIIEILAQGRERIDVPAAA